MIEVLDEEEGEDGAPSSATVLRLNRVWAFRCRAAFQSFACAVLDVGMEAGSDGAGIEEDDDEAEAELEVGGRVAAVGADERRRIGGPMAFRAGFGTATGGLAVSSSTSSQSPDPESLPLLNSGLDQVRASDIVFSSFRLSSPFHRAVLAGPTLGWPAEASADLIAGAKRRFPGEADTRLRGDAGFPMFCSRLTDLCWGSGMLGSVAD